MEYPIIEGPARIRDFSYKYLSQYPELTELEKGIPYKEFYYHSHLRNKETEYRILRRITESKEHAEFLVHNSPLTVSLNRYPDILPYRDTLVSLKAHQYINANFVDSTLQNTENIFIATQAPLKSTMGAFWSMIWEHNIELIIMICCITEGGMPKCEEYFPTEEPIVVEDFEVVLDRTCHIFPSLVQRTFLMKSVKEPGNEFREVTHLHGLKWPDQGAPKIKDEYNSIEHIIQTIKNKRLMNPSCKVAVHCSAGIGRTGLLIGIFNMVVALEELIESDIQNSINQARVSVFGTARRLREQRWGMVSNLKQYKFMYRYMEYWITSYLINQSSLI